MNRSDRAASRIIAGLALLVLLPLGAGAQDLPDAAQIVDRYVEALGGHDLLVSRQNSRSTGSFSMPAAGLSGTMDVRSMVGRVLQRFEIEGYGTSMTGYDGEVGWSVDPNLGPRLLEGKELDALKESASIDASLRSADAYPVRETVELAEMNGQACHKVRFVSAAGRESFDCFSTESGLKVATITTQETPMGAIEVLTLIGDYRDFDGINMPTRMTQQIYGAEQIITVETVEYGVVTEEDFTPPPAIQTLIDPAADGG